MRIGCQGFVHLDVCAANFVQQNGIWKLIEYSARTLGYELTILFAALTTLPGLATLFPNAQRYLICPAEKSSKGSLMMRVFCVFAVRRAHHQRL